MLSHDGNSKRRNLTLEPIFNKSKLRGPLFVWILKPSHGSEQSSCVKPKSLWLGFGSKSGNILRRILRQASSPTPWRGQVLIPRKGNGRGRRRSVGCSPRVSHQTSKTWNPLRLCPKASGPLAHPVSTSDLWTHPARVVHHREGCTLVLDGKVPVAILHRGIDGVRVWGF